MIVMNCKPKDMHMKSKANMMNEEDFKEEDEDEEEKLVEDEARLSAKTMDMHDTLRETFKT